MTLQKFLNYRPQQAPQISFFTVAEGAAPPEGEGNPAEGGCFASEYITARVYNCVLDRKLLTTADTVDLLSQATISESFVSASGGWFERKANSIICIF